MRAILRFWANDSASTAIEYSLIGCGIAVVIIATVQGLGTSVNGMFTQVSSALK
jgi:pilus assembly protein Flp/PilA